MSDPNEVLIPDYPGLDEFDKETVRQIWMLHDRLHVFTLKASLAEHDQLAFRAIREAYDTLLERVEGTLLEYSKK